MIVFFKKVLKTDTKYFLCNFKIVKNNSKNGLQTVTQIKSNVNKLHSIKNLYGNI